MKTSIELIINRSKATRHVQESIQSSWKWNEKTLEQWDNEISGLEKMQDACSTAKFTLNSARAALDAGLQDLHRRTMQFIAMAKFHFRDDPSKFEALSRLTAGGGVRREIAREARDLETAWQEACPEWAPTGENTFASFQALRKQCVELDAAAMAAQNAWRTQSGILDQKAAALNKANIAWYAAVTRIYPSGTAEGGIVRRSIPTRSSAPAPVELPAPVSQPQPVTAA
jgi:hypothetical protein